MSPPQHASADRPMLIIVCGLPATGKSSLAEALRDALGWPLFTKDAVKELLYDAVDRDGTPFSQADSMLLGQQSFALLFAIGREVLASGASCILEGNFSPKLAEDDFAPLLELANGRQVHCSIPDTLAVQRYQERAQAGERHPVHVDGDDESRLLDRIEEGAGAPLPLDIPLLPVDSSTGWDPALPEIVTFCRT